MSASRIGSAMVLLGGTGLIAVTVMVVGTHLGQRGDERSRWSMGVPWRTSRILTEWLGVVSVEFIVVALAVAVGIALLRRRVGRAAGAVLVVVGANVTTQVLKAAIPRPQYGIGAENSLPSGHVTVVASLVLAALFVLPGRLRAPVALLAAGAGTLTAAATIIQRWHRPSDVLAAYGVCAIWAGVALLVADRAARRSPPTSRAPGPGLLRHAWPALAGAALAGAFLVLAGMVTQGEASNVLVGGVSLGAAGIVCAGVVWLTAAGLDARPPTGQRSHTGPRHGRSRGAQTAGRRPAD